jgi:hypothetical protein
MGAVFPSESVTGAYYRTPYYPDRNKIVHVDSRRKLIIGFVGKTVSREIFGGHQSRTDWRWRTNELGASWPFVTGMADKELLARSEYLVAEGS